MRKQIFSEKGAPPQGIYSQGIVAEGPMVYVSGQGPIDPASGERKQGSFREQAEQVFQNIGAILEAANTSWDNAVKVGIFLADLDDFAEMNEIYQQYVSEPYPARTTLQAGLPGIALEVDCVALVPQE